MREPETVVAYNTRTGRKLDHRVPRHFVEQLAGVTGLSATPRGKKKADPAPAVKAENTTEKDK